MLVCISVVECGCCVESCVLSCFSGGFCLCVCAAWDFKQHTIHAEDLYDAVQLGLWQR